MMMFISRWYTQKSDRPGSGGPYIGDKQITRLTEAMDGQQHNTTPFLPSIRDMEYSEFIQ